MKKIVLISFFIFLVSTSFFVYLGRDTKLYSRKVMELAETLVSHDMSFSPVGASNTYAGASVVYYKVLNATGDSRIATLATVKFLNDIYKGQEYNEFFKKFLISLNLVKQGEFSDKVKEQINAAESNIYENKNWVLTNNFKSGVPPPPKVDGTVMTESIKNSVLKTNNRSSEEGALINFWSGMHMSPSISGIWQDRLYDLTKNYYLTDKEYAYAQYVLAISLADTLNETWKIKFKYNAPRPSKLSKEINLSMEDPLYPSYASEYSASAEVAKYILTELFPYTRKIVEADSVEAGEIGIWSGCSLDFDESAGRQLGIDTSNEIDKILKLQVVSKGSFLPLEIFTRKVGVYERGY